MGVNVPRLIVSGLVAGFVINLGELAVNVWLLGDVWMEALAGLGVSVALPTLVLLGVGSFILGIVGVWIYVATRRQYGDGAATAVRAGLAVWAVTYLYAAVGLMGLAMMPAWLLVTVVTWGLVEMAVAVYLGAWLYREGELAVT